MWGRELIGGWIEGWYWFELLVMAKDWLKDGIWPQLFDISYCYIDGLQSGNRKNDSRKEPTASHLKIMSHSRIQKLAAAGLFSTKMEFEYIKMDQFEMIVFNYWLP